MSSVEPVSNPWRDAFRKGEAPEIERRARLAIAGGTDAASVLRAVVFVDEAVRRGWQLAWDASTSERLCWEDPMNLDPPDRPFANVAMLGSDVHHGILAMVQAPSVRKAVPNE
jgi:hypothetical protein